MTRKFNPMQGNNNTIHDRKVIFFFVLFSLAIIVFGFWYLRKNLKDPLVIDLPDFILETIEEQEEKNKKITIAELKVKDTDHDGLTDYQELYQYHTSIFLEDTDSDGHTDYDEVMDGEEPLCPRGEDCNLLALITPSSKLSEVVSDVVDDPNLTILQATLNEFRKFLIDNDVPKKDVDKISDNDLLTLLLAVEKSGIASDDISELDSDGIRNFLLSQPGSNEDEINSLSDNELLQIRDQLIQN